jgi:hypothetical protein
MFWGAISHYGKSKLIVLEWPEVRITKSRKPKKGAFTNKEYAEQVILGAMRRFYESEKEARGGSIFIMEDGAPVHSGPFVRAAKENSLILNSSTLPNLPT